MVINQEAQQTSIVAATVWDLLCDELIVQ